MSIENTVKEEKTLVIAMVEDANGVDKIKSSRGNNPTPFQQYALLCSNLDIQTNPNLLERENYSPSLSPDTPGVARMLAQLTFTTELRGSGVLGVAPRLDPLFRGAAMTRTTVTAGAAGQIGSPVPGANNASAASANLIASITKTTAPTSRFDRYRLTITTGGAGGTAAYIVTGAGFPELDATVMPSTRHYYQIQTLLGLLTVGGTVAAPTFTVSGTWEELDMIELFVGGVRFYYQVPDAATNNSIATALAALVAADARFTGTSATTGVVNVTLAGAAAPITTSNAGTQVVTLGASGAQVTLPAQSGSFTAGETFEFQLYRVGILYTPASENLDSVSFWVLLDGNLHRMTGARGTFSVSGAAAQYATIQWTFTGLYFDPVRYPIPAGVAFEQSLPWKVERSQFALAELPMLLAAAESFSMDIANEVNPRDNINADEAYDEILITDRSPTVGANPEAIKVDLFNPWPTMRRGATSRFHVAVGVRGGIGNIIRIQADRTSYTAAPYAARNNMRAYSITQRCGRVSANGDDELSIFFG